VIISAVVFFILTIRSGQGWGGDFALYIAHAINITTGQPYTDTGYVFNPNNPFLSPRSYPPVYPLLLAPVYHFFGLDLDAMKIAGILTFAVFLLLFYRYVCKRLDSPVAQVLVVAAIAFSPWYWAAKDHVLPDFIFILLFYLTIFIMDRIGVPEKFGWRRVLLALTVGFTAYLAYGARSLGLALIPALAMSDVVRHRKISRATLIAATVFGVLYFTQNIFLETDKSYADTYKIWLSSQPKQDSGATEVEARHIDIGRFVSKTLRTIDINANHYHQLLISYWANGFSVGLRNVVYIATGMLAIIGFLGLVIRNPSTGDYALMAYAAILLLAPFLQDRYLLPLIPMYLLYIFRGGEVLFARGAFAATKGMLLNGTIPVVIAGVIMLSYLGSYSTRDFGDFTSGVEVQESVELFEFLRTTTPADSLIVFRKPRILALYTGRDSVRYHTGINNPDLWDYLVTIGATHVVVGNEAVVPEEPEYVDWVERYSSSLELIFSNRDFRVFRMKI
jgi:hypothetical protein